MSKSINFLRIGSLLLGRTTSDLRDEYDTLSPILDAWAKDKNLNDDTAINQLLDVCNDPQIMIRTAVEKEVRRRAARKVRSGNA